MCQSKNLWIDEDANLIINHELDVRLCVLVSSHKKTEAKDWDLKYEFRNLNVIILLPTDSFFFFFKQVGILFFYQEQ